MLSSKIEYPNTSDECAGIEECDWQVLTKSFEYFWNLSIHKYFSNRWIEQFEELSKKFLWVQIFENKGAIMGCSNPHPHCQIWAASFFPNEPRIKDMFQKEYYEKCKRPMLMDYVQRELEKKVILSVSKNETIYS